MMRMLCPGEAVVVVRGNIGDAWSGFAGRVAGGAGGWEVVALPSFLACWGLGTGAPLFSPARFGGTGGVRAGWAWG